MRGFHGLCCCCWFFRPSSSFLCLYAARVWLARVLFPLPWPHTYTSCSISSLRVISNPIALFLLLKTDVASLSNVFGTSTVSWFTVRVGSERRHFNPHWSEVLPPPFQFKTSSQLGGYWQPWKLREGLKEVSQNAAVCWSIHVTWCGRGGLYCSRCDLVCDIASMQ